MNIYRWVHLDSEGYKKDGPFTIVAKDINRAKALAFFQNILDKGV